jgi:septal ring factor EnvC (AmiA/AmiB activator)
MEWIPWIISATACLFGILSYARAGHKDQMRDKAEQMARLENLSEGLIKANIKLDQVCQTTTETRTEIKALNTSVTEMDKRVSVLENDLKTAFMRIDEVREAVNHIGVDKR